MTKLVGDAGDERRLGRHDDEVDAERPRQLEDRLGVLGANRVAVAERRDARVSRRGVELLEQRGLRQPPGQRVLPPARAQ